MEKLTPHESERQAKILWPIRRQQHHELGDSGVAARIIAADSPFNADQLKDEFGEGELVFPFRAQLESGAQDLFGPLLKENKNIQTVLELSAATQGLKLYLIGMGRYRQLPRKQKVEHAEYFVGLQVHNATPNRANYVHALDPITQHDAGFIAAQLGRIAELALRHNLTCLNDNLLNEQIRTRVGLPLP